MRKHARAAAARVTIRGDGDSVVVEVVDNGAGPTGRRPRGEDTGHGLVGMRERVAACGGVLEAGPGAAGGFRVMARLPFAGGPVTVRVVVVDDQALVRPGFRVLVDSAPDLEEVGEAADGAQAVDVVVQERPDVVAGPSAVAASASG